MILHQQRAQGRRIGKLAGVVVQEGQDRSCLVDRRLVRRGVLLTEGERLLHRRQGLVPHRRGPVGGFASRIRLAGSLRGLHGGLCLLEYAEGRLSGGECCRKILLDRPQFLAQPGRQFAGLLREVAVGRRDLAGEFVGIGLEQPGRGGFLLGERRRPGGEQFGSAVLHRGHFGRQRSFLDRSHREPEVRVRAVFVRLERRRSGDIAILLLVEPALQGHPEGLRLEGESERRERLARCRFEREERGEDADRGVAVTKERRAAALVESRHVPDAECAVLFGEVVVEPS